MPLRPVRYPIPSIAIPIRCFLSSIAIQSIHPLSNVIHATLPSIAIHGHLHEKHTVPEVDAPNHGDGDEQMRRESLNDAQADAVIEHSTRIKRNKTEHETEATTMRRAMVVTAPPSTDGGDNHSPARGCRLGPSP